MLARLVFLLFLTILFNQTFAQQEDSLVLSNAVLHYYVYGQGTPILLLSGGPGISSHQEDDLAIHLSKTYSAILFDQRGTGKSWTKTFESTTINQACCEHLYFYETAAAGSFMTLIAFEDKNLIRVIYPCYC